MTLSETIAIRPASDEDVDAIASIWRAGWVDGHLGHVPTELEHARLNGSWAAAARQRIDATWVACDSRAAAVGFVTVVGDELEQVYVTEHARGCGVAAALLRHGEQIVGSHSADVAWLAVAAGNVRARRFYEREGWTDAGPFEYRANTTNGTIAVQAHRYEYRLRQTYVARRRSGCSK